MLRRDFFADLARAAALCAVVPNVWRVTGRPIFADDPFTLGVASGDPTASGGVLWTRLAPRPLEPDGGMSGRRVAVRWEVADDEGFTRIVRRGTATSAPELSYSVHVDVDGLSPNRWYFYRFITGDAVSPVGRFRTTPAAGVVAPLSLAVASCQHWESGYFTAYDHMAREQVDLVAHLGDYIYEHGASEGRVRQHVGLEIRTLDDYRRRYAQYRTDRALQDAHARCPWLVTWDDHEVDNNYADLIGELGMESDEQMHQRRAAAYQAWWEHMPVRVPRARSWANLDITRAMDWGALARFWVLDTRQYRSDQACDDGSKAVPCGDWGDPARTLLGERQERWLHEGVGASTARWQVLANQVMVAPFDTAAGAETQVSMDQWSGYPAARGRLLNAIAERAANRTVVLTGDIHSAWVNEIHADFSVDERRTIGAEFVATSITSNLDGSDASFVGTAERRADNPHVRWNNQRRGYIRCDVTAESWTAAFRVVPFVSRPGAPLLTPTTWRVENGRPGITQL